MRRTPEARSSSGRRSVVCQCRASRVRAHLACGLLSPAETRRAAGVQGQVEVLVRLGDDKPSFKSCTVPASALEMRCLMGKRSMERTRAWSEEANFNPRRPRKLAGAQGGTRPWSLLSMLNVKLGCVVCPLCYS